MTGYPCFLDPKENKARMKLAERINLETLQWLAKYIEAPDTSKSDEIKAREVRRKLIKILKDFINNGYGMEESEEDLLKYLL